MAANPMPAGVVWDDDLHDQGASQEDQQTTSQPANALPPDVVWDDTDSAPSISSTTAEAPPEEPVPDWGAHNPNLYGVYGAAKETGGALAKAVVNIPQSAAGVAGDLYQAVRHPVDTVEAVGKTALGAAELAIPGEQEHEENARALGKFFIDRYGTTEGLRKTLEEDPVGLAMDLSGFLAAGGAALKGAGVVAKAAGTARAGETLAQVGKVASEAATIVDPINQAANVGAATMRGVGKVGAEVLGATTGAGPEAIRQAARGEQGFKDALRGKVAPDDILSQAQDALSVIRDERNATYRQRLAELQGIDQEIDISGIKKRTAQMLDSYNVKVAEDGTLDFSRSRLNPQEAADVQGSLDEIMSWGSREGDLTPGGLDILKSRLDNFYSDSSRARGMVTLLRGKVKADIVAAVPEYATMTRDYEVVTRDINEMQRALSLNDRAMMDTAVKKLTSTMRENFEFRRQLLERLEQGAGVDLRPQIAGVTMQQFTPKGLIGKGAAASTAMGSWVTANPAALGGLLLASPRVVGEFLAVSGVGRQRVNKLLMSPEFRKARGVWEAARGSQAAYQAGRVSEVTTEPEEMPPGN